MGLLLADLGRAAAVASDRPIGTQGELHTLRLADGDLLFVKGEIEELGFALRDLADGQA